MSFVLPTGVLAISIDLELDATQRMPQQQLALEKLTGQLLKLLGAYRLPATWAVADPAVSAATDRIVDSQAGHEIALLGDHSWVGVEAGRNRFQRELQRRTTRARSLGYSIGTLMLRDARLDDHADLAVKQQISAVCPPLEGLPSLKPVPLQSGRFGLWELAVSQVLPGTSRWLPGGGGLRTARRGIARAIAERRAYHLLISALQMAIRGHLSLRVLEKVLRRAEARCRQGDLQVLTFGGMTGLASRGRQAAPSRSILKPAA